jgi:hypothetical protein
MAPLFTRKDIPIAFSMIDAAGRIKPRRDGRHPVDKFFLLWTAFNSIYTTIADRRGYRTRLVVGEDGEVVTSPNGGVSIPEVEPVREREQLYLALEVYSDELKDSLIRHTSTQFFANRVPFWQGKQVKYDALGQRINGVIDLDYTTSKEYPVWSPIDYQIYDRYLEDPENQADRDFLTRQIADLLYTIRKNLVHIGRTFDDGQDLTVFEHGMPLLELIVSFFTQ